MAYGKKIVGLGDAVISVGYDLTRGSCIVVVAVDQHQTTVGLHTVYVPPQLAVFGNDTVLDLGNNGRIRLLGLFHNGGIEHLTVLAEGIRLCGKQVVGLGDGVRSARQDFTRGSCIVVVAVDQHQTAVGLHTVYVPPQLAVLGYDTVLDLRLFDGGIDHLAVRIKVIVAYGKKIVGLGDAVVSVAYNFTVSSCVVIRAVDQHQTAIIVHTVNNPVLLAVFFNNAVEVGVFSDKGTVLVEQIPENTFRLVVTVLGDRTGAGEHIVVFTEIILNAVKSYPAALDKGGADAVSGAGAVGRPCTHSPAVFIEGIGNTADGLGGIHIQLIIAAGIPVHRVGCAAVDVVIAFVRAHILPALDELIVDRIVEGAVHFKYAGTCKSNVAAGRANELCLNDRIVMALCRDNGAEVNNRLTTLTVGSVGITVFGAGCILVENGKLGIMLVIGRRNGCQLGCHVNGAREGVSVNNTAHNGNVNVNNGPVAGNCYIFFSHVVIAIPSPNAHGNAHERVIKRSRANAVCSFNGNGKDLGNFVVIKSSLEAACNDGSLSFPLVCIV